MTKKQILLLTIILGAANNIALAMEKTTKQQKKLNKKLILAISKSELDGVHYYLKKGANPNAEEIFGKRAIICADAGAFYFVSQCGAPRPISVETSDCQITMAFLAEIQKNNNQ